MYIYIYIHMYIHIIHIYIYIYIHIIIRVRLPPNSSSYTSSSSPISRRADVPGVRSGPDDLPPPGTSEKTILYTIYYIPYTIHYLLYTINYTLYAVHRILYTIYYTRLNWTRLAPPESGPPRRTRPSPSPGRR